MKLTKIKYQWTQKSNGITEYFKSREKSVNVNSRVRQKYSLYFELICIMENEKKMFKCFKNYDS